MKQKRDEMKETKNIFLQPKREKKMSLSLSVAGAGEAAIPTDITKTHTHTFEAGYHSTRRSSYACRAEPSTFRWLALFICRLCARDFGRERDANQVCFQTIFPAQYHQTVTPIQASWARMTFSSAIGVLSWLASCTYRRPILLD